MKTMPIPTTAKEILDTLHHFYMKRETCSLRFESDCGAVTLVMKNGDIVSACGDHFDRGGGFMEVLRGEISGVALSKTQETTPGQKVDAAMEMILFEMAAGMDVQVSNTLDNVRKTGKLPPEVVESVTVPQQVAEVVAQTEKQQIFLLEQGETVLGRASSADLVIVEPTLSRRHAMVRIEDGSATVENLSKANGTFVNRKLIVSCPLVEGSLLSLGNTVFKFFWSDCGRGILFRINEEKLSPEDQATFMIPS